MNWMRAVVRHAYRRPGLLHRSKSAPKRAAERRRAARAPRAALGGSPAVVAQLLLAACARRHGGWIEAAAADEGGIGPAAGAVDNPHHACTVTATAAAAAAAVMRPSLRTLLAGGRQQGRNTRGRALVTVLLGCLGALLLLGWEHRVWCRQWRRWRRGDLPGAQHRRAIALDHPRRSD